MFYLRPALSCGQANYLASGCDLITFLESKKKVPIDEMIAKIFIIAFLVESIVIHEMAHGYVALLFGDQTAKRQERITFNPIPHIDLLWTIVIPIVAYFLSGGTFIIGGAKPVPVNPFNYRRQVGESFTGTISVEVSSLN